MPWKLYEPAVVSLTASVASVVSAKKPPCAVQT